MVFRDSIQQKRFFVLNSVLHYNSRQGIQSINKLECFSETSVSFQFENFILPSAAKADQDGFKNDDIRCSELCVVRGHVGGKRGKNRGSIS